MISEAQWQSLEKQQHSGHGVLQRRVAAQSGHDLYVGVQLPRGSRLFWMDVAVDAAAPDYRLPSLRSIAGSVRPVTGDPTLVRVLLELESPDLNSVFRALVNDVVAAVTDVEGSEAALRVLEARMERWKRLLQTDGRRGLSGNERRGLFGELVVLLSLLDRYEAADAVRLWTGPYGKHQDFQSVTGAIEVKTSSTKQPQSLVIASERELDNTGIERLFLWHVSLDERQGGNGRSLIDIVEQAREVVTESPSALDMLDEALLQLGYLPSHRDLYVEPHYSIRGQSAYEVAEGFPRIVESMLPTGVGDVSYRIQVAALAPFVVEIGDVLMSIGGGQ